jgi:hypothetical protein
MSQFNATDANENHPEPLRLQRRMVSTLRESRLRRYAGRFTTRAGHTAAEVSRPSAWHPSCPAMPRVLPARCSMVGRVGRGRIVRGIGAGGCLLAVCGDMPARLVGVRESAWQAQRILRPTTIRFSSLGVRRPLHEAYLSVGPVHDSTAVPSGTRAIPSTPEARSSRPNQPHE